MAAKKTTTERFVIVTTEFKGVFAGWSTDTTGDVIQLRAAKMAIYWGGTKGFMRLAKDGPNSGDRISAPADIEVRKITAVTEVTSEAIKAWEAA